MIKYLNYAVTFQEVPDEVSLCFNITNCTYHCPECHSPELRQDIGYDLDADLMDIVNKYRDGITCICLLGDGNDMGALVNILYKIRRNFPELKTCIYTGSDDGIEFAEWIHIGLIDYIKIGPYDKTLGGLNSITTNQRMFYNINGQLIDITDKFLRKKV